jgi:excisionase family DNA binding protein
MSTSNELIELHEQNRMLREIALSAIAMMVNVESGFVPPPLHAIKRDLAAYTRRFGPVPSKKETPRFLKADRASPLTVSGRLLTVDELAWVTGWKVATIRQKVWRRKLPYVKLGKSLRFRESDIARLIADAEVPASK